MRKALRGLSAPILPDPMEPLQALNRVDKRLQSPKDNSGLSRTLRGPIDLNLESDVNVNIPGNR
jgi:hypothetical protein